MASDIGVRPLVSIVVPSYNQGRFLRETLDSIVTQDYRPLEVIVIDGGSTDETVEILREVGERHSEVQWWSEADEGVADAVNKGLSKARGTYAGIQSSDDMYRPGAISSAVAALESDGGLGLVYADMDIVDQDGAFIVLAGNRLPFTRARFLARMSHIHQSSTFFRLDLAREVGGWNPRYFCCDTEMWLRMIFRAGARRIDEVWSAWRLHEDQRNREAAKMWDAWGRMIADSPDLRDAPFALRRAAAAGRRLVALDYSPSESRWFLTAQVWLAILTYPPSYAAVYPKTLLVPGFARLRALWRRARR